LLFLGSFKKHAMVPRLLQAFKELFFPRYCVVCGKRLDTDTYCLCDGCFGDLPRTNYHRWEDNPVEKMYWGKFPLGHATAFFFYEKNDMAHQILEKLKYRGRYDLAEYMGRRMAEEISSESDFFEGIDAIVPIPLHPKRFRQRGYNQSERLARGISAVTGIPVDTSLVQRVKNTATQTHKTMRQRFDSLQEAFAVADPEKCRGLHLLIVDDVLTTGATTTACADAFPADMGIKFSFLTLAVASQ